MDKFLLPGAIIVASIIVATTFRVEMRPLGMSGESYLMQDRWTGVVSRCGAFMNGCVRIAR